MLPWDNRPSEIAALLNPAFCSILLFDSIRGFHVETSIGMPYSLIFLTLPLVLHEETREALPSRVDSKIHVWLENNPRLNVGYVQRSRTLVPIIKEAILFSINGDMITLDDDGTFSPVTRKIDVKAWKKGTEPALCREKSYFIGRWLAKAGDEYLIYKTLGLRP